jgi:hypothetical protein
MIFSKIHKTKKKTESVFFLCPRQDYPNYFYFYPIYCNCGCYKNHPTFKQHRKSSKSRKRDQNVTKKS